MKKSIIVLFMLLICASVNASEVIMTDGVEEWVVTSSFDTWADTLSEDDSDLQELVKRVEALEHKKCVTFGTWYEENKE